MAGEIERLEAIVSQGIYHPELGRREALFGDNCLLWRAGLEAVRGGLQARLNTCIQKLLAQTSLADVGHTTEKNGSARVFDPAETADRRSPETRDKPPPVFRQLYGQKTQDQQVWAQGEQMVHGLCKTILASCNHSIDHRLATEAVGHFDQAWPIDDAVSLPEPPPLQADADFGAYWTATGGSQGAGYWVVWDLIERFRGKQSQTGTAPPEMRTASIPVLLFGERGSSQVGLLTVELVLDGGRGFRPDPFRMGLTALDVGDQSFHVSMQRAWNLSELDRCGCRGRWFVTTFRPIHSGEALRASCLSGRSGEAAACCALWAAMGRIPGEKNQQPNGVLELDPLATISAQLLDGDEKGREIRIGRVDGVPQKLKAAVGAGLEMILLADGQDPGDFADHRKKRPGDPILVRTMGEAFEHLLVYRRTLRNYQDHVTQRWREQWLETPDDAVSQ